MSVVGTVITRMVLVVHQFFIYNKVNALFLIMNEAERCSSANLRPEQFCQEFFRRERQP